jgi:hypothetical protein
MMPCWVWCSAPGTTEVTEPDLRGLCTAGQPGLRFRRRWIGGRSHATAINREQHDRINCNEKAIFLRQISCMSAMLHGADMGTAKASVGLLL